MDFLFLFITGIFLSFFGLVFLHIASPTKFELKIIDNTPTAIIYTNYFFLPFTIKIRKYKDIKGAYVESRIQKGKHITYTVYDLVLKFPKKSIVLFMGKKNRENILKYCEKINQSIASFEECFLTEPAVISRKTVLLILLVCLPLFILMPSKNSRDSYMTDITRNMYIYLTAAGVLAIFIILSLFINLLINSVNKRNDKLFVDYNKKENVDIDSEAKRINDSLIK